MFVGKTVYFYENFDMQNWKMEECIGSRTQWSAVEVIQGGEPGLGWQVEEILDKMKYLAK